MFGIFLNCKYNGEQHRLMRKSDGVHAFRIRSIVGSSQIFGMLDRVKDVKDVKDFRQFSGNFFTILEAFLHRYCGIFKGSSRGLFFNYADYFEFAKFFEFSGDF